MFTRILIPVDGSPLAEQAIQPAMKLAHQFDCDVVLVRIATSLAAQLSGFAAGLPDAGNLYLAMVQQAHNDAANYLASLQDTLQYARIKTQFQVVDGGQVAEEILNIAEGQQCDLIVMGTHGRSGVRRWLLGSVAERVLRHASIPVLLVPVIEL